MSALPLEADIRRVDGISARVFFTLPLRTNCIPDLHLPQTYKWIQIKRICVSTWGRPINGRTHNEKSTRMHRHAGLWHHPRSRLSPRSVGNLSVWYLLAGMGPRRIQRNSPSRDNDKSAVTFGNEKATVAHDGKFVVCARAFLVAGSRARRCGRRALESFEGESRLKKMSRSIGEVTAAHLCQAAQQHDTGRGMPSTRSALGRKRTSTANRPS